MLEGQKNFLQGPLLLLFFQIPILPISLPHMGEFFASLLKTGPTVELK